LDAPATPPLLHSPSKALSPAPASIIQDLLFPVVNLHTATDEDLVAGIASSVAAGTGAIRVRGLESGAAPLAAIRELFDFVAARPALVQRANKAYKKNLVYKDTYAAGKVCVLRRNELLAVSVISSVLIHNVVVVPCNSD
jgi:hypothetical protein